MWATVDRNGSIYFVSDEANGEYNLYTFVNGQKTALTSFKESIKRPQVSADGRKVVFEKTRDEGVDFGKLNQLLR